MNFPRIHLGFIRKPYLVVWSLKDWQYSAAKGKKRPARSKVNFAGTGGKKKTGVRTGKTN